MAMPELACIAAQSREHTRAITMLSDLEYAYQLQVEEAMAASTGQDYEAWQSAVASGQERQGRERDLGQEDVRLAVQLQSRELARCEQVLDDQRAVEAATRAVAESLQQRTHDLEFARSISEVPDDEWEEIGDTIEHPLEAAVAEAGDVEDGEGSSGLDCDQSFEIEVQGVKTPDGHVGVGCMLTDLLGNVVWQQSKYMGVGLSWHVGEYTGLLESLTIAERLGLRRLRVRVSSSLVGNQVKGFWKPKATSQWTLMNQVIKTIQSFSSFHLVSGSKAAGSISVNQLAQAAIANQLGNAPTSNGEASTSGSSHNDVQEHLPVGDLISAGPSKRRRLENCLICLEDKTSLEMATVKGCLHKFCVVCMKQHAATQVQANQVPVRCPQAGCPKTLGGEECRPFLTIELFHTLSKRLIEASVPEGDRVYCPFANCSALMDKSGLALPPEASSSAVSKVYHKVQCVACRRSFCVDCRVPWHWNRSCQDYQNLPPELRDAEDSNLYKLAQNENWQRCKKCRRMIELAEGCYHMTCRCGHEFCYTCGAEWKNKKQTCSCKLWDERNIVRTPINSEDEFEDDQDDYDDDEDMEEENYDEGYTDEDDEDAESFFFDELSHLSLRGLVNGMVGANGRTLDLREPPLVANHFYKTKLCRYYLRSGGCKQGSICNFAHGEHELRHVGDI